MKQPRFSTTDDRYQHVMFNMYDNFYIHPPKDFKAGLGYKLHITIPKNERYGEICQKVIDILVTFSVTFKVDYNIHFDNGTKAFTIYKPHLTTVAYMEMMTQVEALLKNEGIPPCASTEKSQKVPGLDYFTYRNDSISELRDLLIDLDTSFKGYFYAGNYYRGAFCEALLRDKYNPFTEHKITLDEFAEIMNGYQTTSQVKFPKYAVHSSSMRKLFALLEKKRQVDSKHVHRSEIVRCLGKTKCSLLFGESTRSNKDKSSATDIVMQLQQAFEKQAQPAVRLSPTY